MKVLNTLLALSLTATCLGAQSALADDPRVRPSGPNEPATSESSEAKDKFVRDMSNFFGASTAAVGRLVSDVFSELGTPNAVIKGEEGSGAFVIGFRKGEGILNFAGQKRHVYWNGPTIGFDIGGDASKVYVLVYKMRNANQIYRKFGGAEGKLYFVAGAGAQLGGAKYAGESSDLVIVPIRMGVGWRQGVNVGYLNFTDEDTWLPF